MYTYIYIYILLAMITIEHDRDHVIIAMMDPGTVGVARKLRLCLEDQMNHKMGAIYHIPEGPSTQYLRTMVPNTIKRMAFGTRVLKYWLLGPSGISFHILPYTKMV